MSLRESPVTRFSNCLRLACRHMDGWHNGSVFSPGDPRRWRAHRHTDKNGRARSQNCNRVLYVSAYEQQTANVHCFNFPSESYSSISAPSEMGPCEFRQSRCDSQILPTISSTVSILCNVCFEADAADAADPGNDLERLASDKAL